MVGEGGRCRNSCKMLLQTTSCTCQTESTEYSFTLPSSPLIHSEKVNDTMKAAALILCVFAWLFVATIAKPADDGPLCAFCMTTTGWIEGKSE